MSASSGYGGSGSSPSGPFVETLTGNTGGAVGPDVSNNINVVGSGGITVTGNPGTNTLTITGPGESSQYTADTGTAAPSGGNINLLGGNSTAGKNIHTTASGSTVDTILNDSLLFPSTNNTGTEGVLFWNAQPSVHFYGGNNAFFGMTAGNLTLNTANAAANTGIGQGSLTSLVGSVVNDGTANTAVGNGSLASLTDGSFNTAVGSSNGSSFTTGQGNIFIGHQAGDTLVSGNTNILIGSDDNLGATAPGKNYNGSESNNIILGNAPGVTGENNVMRLGLDGSGVSDQNATYIGGVYNRTFGSPSGVVQIDSNFKVGSSAGTNGQLLIGSTGASPAWGNLTSTGGTVTITNGANTINLEANGTPGGASSFPADVGIATEAAGVLNVFSGATSSFNNINTNASGNTVHVRLNDSISLPSTNSSATTGVLSLGGHPFVQGYGSGNTFLGQQAGNLTLTIGSAIDNVAVGYQALPSVTTGAENTYVGSASGTNLTTGGTNVGIGFGALDEITTGSGNIAIGVLAGSNYTSSESNNIVVGSLGTVSESGTIRIGRSPTHTSAYMAGVYNASIGSTNAPVYIDNTGKLGTLESGTSLAGSSFMAVVTGTEILSSGSSIVGTFFVGSQQMMMILWDNFGSSFYAGSGVGSPAVFTAPVDGFYNFVFNCQLSNLTTGSILDVIIAVNSSQYATLQSPYFQGSGGMRILAQSLNTTIKLNAGDTVTFGAQCNASPTNPPGGFLGGFASAPPWVTTVMGTLLKTAP